MKSSRKKNAAKSPTHSFAPSWLIERKRDGHELTPEEILAFVRGVTDGTFADYQATAFLMAVFFQGMSLRETCALTETMLASGERYDFSHLAGPFVDKHSTGGVGDKVSVILAPLAAACGVKVPMMSGRGLGATGGTLDKLESIPGFQTQLSSGRFEELLVSLGCGMIGQSATIVPADKKLYALRDVTATVECVPLIVASILSKKLAEGAQSLVLDVKVGSGAFMKTRHRARTLAKALITVSKHLGLPCRALITNMDQPLGYAVGNALEIKECVEILRNTKTNDLPSADLKELTVQLCAHMLDISGRVRNLAEGRKLAHSKLADGSAWEIFKKLVEAQGGELRAIEEAPFLHHKAPRQTPILADRSGHLVRTDAGIIGKILIELGGGRKKASDTVNPSVGLVFHKKTGSRVKMGETLAVIHSENDADLSEIESLFRSAIEISNTRKAGPKLIFERL
ncbi:MAG: thymidine phosphorylase [Bdellovibrio sp.]|nr:thymidine phosphorylase [Bdellovibrio sp.]